MNFPVRAVALAAWGLSTVSGQDGSLGDLELIRTVELKAPLRHVQGVEVDGGKVWVSSVDRESRKGFLHEFRLSDGSLVRFVEVQDGPRFHPGGISADSESVWVPVAEYRPGSSAVIQRRRKSTLGLEFQFNVADHIGCIAASGDEIIGGNWDSRELYVWDPQGRLQRKLPNVFGNGYQDMKFNGDVLVASGLLPMGGGGAIDWFELPSFRLLRRLMAGKTDRGVFYTREGMAIRNGLLYLLPEDGPSRLFVFRLGEKR